MPNSLPVKYPSAVAFVAALVRWDEWYDSKVPLFLVCMYYAALSRPRLDAGLLGEMALLMAVLCIYASVGHMANDLSDRAADRAAGKRNVLARIHHRRARTLVLLAAIVGVLPAGLFYFERPDVIALLGLAYVLAALYSLPPVRLKERGILGIVAAAIAQRLLPALIAFRALDVWDWTAAAMCLLSTLIGLRCILVHQLIDIRNDIRAGVRTFGTVHGVPYLCRLITRVLFPLELTSLIVAVLTMAAGLPAVGVLAAVYGIWLYVLTRLQWRWNPISYNLFRDFYFVLWPLLLATLLSIRSIAFLSVLILTALWQYRMLRREIGAAVRLVTARPLPETPTRLPAHSQSAARPKDPLRVHQRAR